MAVASVKLTFFFAAVRPARFAFQRIWNRFIENPLKDIYSELSDHALLKSTRESYLTKYNTEMSKKKLKIVLFLSAMMQISQILRIITLPFEHSLMIEIGGSSYKSLIALASFIAKYKVFKIKSKRDYKKEQWRTDLRSLMNTCGINKNHTLLLVNDNQIKNDVFMEDINSLLNTGEVPDLYENRKQSGIKDDLKQRLRDNLQLHFKRTFNSDDSALEVLRNQVKETLHICFVMNPTTRSFRDRLRCFPSIVKSTTTLWFLPWPEEALRTVAQQQLSDVELDDKERDGIVNICIDMQERAQELTEKYKKEMEFHYYISPAHYIELLKVFKKLLSAKRKDLTDGINLYETGLQEMKKTEKFVSEMRTKLVEMEPEQKKRNEDAIRLAESLIKKKAEVQDETKIDRKSVV